MTAQVQQGLRLEGYKQAENPTTQEERTVMYGLIIEAVQNAITIKKIELQKVHWEYIQVTVSLEEIYALIVAKATALKKLKLWNLGDYQKRTWDRRVNECTDRRLWKDGVPPLAAASSNAFVLNPLFVGTISEKVIGKSET